MKWSIRGALAVALLLSFVVPVTGQTPGAVVSGTVRDESGLPVPGASVTARRADGRIVGAGETGGNGAFLLSDLPEGELRVEVRLTGFRTAQAVALARVGETAELTLVLGVMGFTDAVTVTASRGERTLASVPSSVGVVSGAVLEQARGLNLAESLQFVPGVMAGDVSGVDDLRISIRGAGIRAGFGSRGVLLMTDGYPVTEPDGQTPHFDGQIDLSNVERVEVVKGPASAMYGGAALGGVVNVITRVPPQRPAATVAVQGGSHAFGKAHLAASAPSGPFVLSGTFGYTHLDGFRAHNSLRDWAGSARADWTDARSRLTLSVFGTDASLNLPGTLNRAQFETNPSGVRDLYVTNDWGRENRLFRFGGRYERELGGGQSVEVDSYGQARDFQHPIFVVIDQDARRYVGHARYRVTHGAHALAVGVDSDTQWVDDRWFVNAGGRPAFQIREDDNTVTNTGVYVQDEITVGARAVITAGVRADRIRYDLIDLLLFDGDASDRRRFDRVSPKLGATAAVTPDVVLYGNVSTGFEAPTLGEVRLPAGFNEEVKPQKAVSVEAGVRGAAGAVSYDVSVYRMAVDDEILPETVNEVTVYRNVARASHTGLEMSARARASRWLVLDATYASSRFTLDEFGALSGNRLPGIPPHVGTVRASLSGGVGWDLFGSLTAASSTYVNDDNSESAGAYGVLSAGAGYRLGRVRLFARGENLGDVRYTNRVQVNDASGFFYYPARGRSGSAGLEVRW